MSSRDIPYSKKKKFIEKNYDTIRWLLESGNFKRVSKAITVLNRARKTFSYSDKTITMDIVSSLRKAFNKMKEETKGSSPP